MTILSHSLKKKPQAVGLILKDIILIENDMTIPLVVCPKAFDVDSPVLMKTVSDSTPAQKDKWMRGFIRRFVNSQFPRTEGDANESLQYIVDHSTGSTRRQFSGYLQELTSYKNLVRTGYYYSFYPDNSLNLSIRATSSRGEWTIEIPGFLIRSASVKEERSVVTLRYTVEVGDHTSANPEGLYVTSSNMRELADPISGREKSKK